MKADARRRRNRAICSLALLSTFVSFPERLPERLDASTPVSILSTSPGRSDPPPPQGGHERVVTARRAAARPVWMPPRPDATRLQERAEWAMLNRVTSISPSRLEYCVEFTKPDSLRIRLMGTPKNHRSPPA